MKTGQLPGERALHRGNVRREHHRGVAGGPQNRRQGGQPGQPVGQRHHLLGDGRLARVVVEQLVVARRARGQRVGQRDGVLNAEVHALPAGGAVNVGGVAGEQEPPGPVGVGDAVVDPEPRTPQHVGDCQPAGAARGRRGAAGRIARRFLRGVVERGDDAEESPRAAARRPSGRVRPEQPDLVGRDVAGQADVGEHEGLLVGVAAEADARLLAHGAVHAVGAHDVARTDVVAVGERRDRAVGVLAYGGQRLGPDDLAAEFRTRSSSSRSVSAWGTIRVNG